MNIGFVGPFGDINFGDYAMLVNNIYAFGQQDYTVFTYNYELICELKQTYLKNYTLSEYILKVKYGYCNKETDKYHVEYDTYAYTPLEILNTLENKAEIENAVKTLDVLVVNGGGYFNHVWSAKHRKAKLFGIMSTILLANSLNIRIVFMGNTFGPFCESQEFFSNFFNNLKNPIYASRDSLFSVSSLRKIGINDQISIIPDDLYFLNEQFNKERTSLLDLPEKYVLLELYDSVANISERMDFIRNFVKSVKYNYGFSVVLLPLDHQYGGEIQCQMIADSIPDVKYIGFQGNHKPRYIEEVLETVNKAEIVLSQRYHLFVLALANNVPAIHALKIVCGDNSYYYAKSAGVLRSVFLNQYYDEADYIAIDIWKGLNIIRDKCPSVIDKQKSLFNKDKKTEEALLMKERERYISYNILN